MTTTTTSRRARPSKARKAKPRKRTANHLEAKIISDCVRYCSLAAASDAAYSADRTPDSKYAAPLAHKSRVQARALLDGMYADTVLSPETLRARGSVASRIARLIWDGAAPDVSERNFLRLYVGEVDLFVRNVQADA